MLKLARPAQSAGSILKYLSIFPATRAKRRKAQDAVLKEDRAPGEESFATDARNSTDSIRALSQDVPFMIDSSLMPYFPYHYHY